MNKSIIIKAFYQGKDMESLGAGNCASVALIKAAIYSYGFDVLQYEVRGHTYHVKLKNGDDIAFTKEELAYASKQSSFIQGKTENDETRKQYKKILDYAHICFATICKMAQKHGDYSQRRSKIVVPDDFEEAVEIINDGTLTPEVYEFLGLEDNVSPVYRKRIWRWIKGKKGLVIWTKSHAMFAANGYFDLYGKPVRLKARFMFKLPGNLVLGLFCVI